MNYRLSSSGNFLTVKGATLSVNTSAFRFFAHGPHKNGTGTIGPRSTTTLGTLVRRRGFTPVLTRTPCAVGPYTTGRGLLRFTRVIVRKSLRVLRCIPKGVCGFRPNDRIGRNTRINVRGVTTLLGDILRGSLRAAILLRAVTNGNARINHDFRRLTTVLDGIRLGRGVNIYLSAYRVFSNNCSVIGSLSNMLTRFSGVVNLRQLGTIRLGSDLGVYNDRGSERTYVNTNGVNLRTLATIVGRPTLHALPFCLRAPGRLPNCTTRVGLLHRHFTRWCAGIFCGE